MPLIKKYIFALLLAVSYCSVFAQTDSLVLISVDTVPKKQSYPAKYFPLYNSPAVFLTNTTLYNQYWQSSGAMSYSAKGFANTFSYNVNELVDGFNNSSALFCAPFSDWFFNTLDARQVQHYSARHEMLIGPAVIGKTTYPFYHPYTNPRLTIAQSNGINNQLGFYNKTQFRYLQAYGTMQNVALTISGEYQQKTEWQYNQNEPLYGGGPVAANLSRIVRDQQYRAIGPDFTQQQKDNYIALNSWLDFNPVASPGTKNFNIPGYTQRNLTQKNFANAKVNAGLYYRPGNGTVEIAAGYRFALVNSIVQPYFRYQLKNYTIHQPRLEVNGSDFKIKISATIENTGQSYNLNRTGYHINRTIDSVYANGYAWNYLDAYFNKLDTLTNGFCGDCVTNGMVDTANLFAINQAKQTHYPVKGEEGFNQPFKSIVTDSSLQTGSAWKANTKTVDISAEYRFGFLRWMNIKLGATYQLSLLQNNEWNTGNKKFHDASTTLSGSKMFWQDRFTVFATGRFNYNTDFGPRGDYRAGISFGMKGQGFSISSGSGYTFPTMAQRYMQVSSYYTPYIANATKPGTYLTFASVKKLNAISLPYDQKLDTAYKVLQRYTVTKLKPQEIKTIELTTQNTIAHKLHITSHLYYNWIQNITALCYMVQTPTGNVAGDTFPDTNLPAQQIAVDNIMIENYTPFITWTNLPVKANSWGAFINLEYEAPYNIVPYINYHYFGHTNINVTNNAIVAINGFNMPAHKLNVGIRSENVWKGLGIEINWRWTAAYNWQTDFVKANVPAYHTLDVVLKYNEPKIHSTVFIGGSNLYNNRHIEIPGMPQIGAWYYAGWKFDLDLNKISSRVK